MPATLQPPRPPRIDIQTTYPQTPGESSPAWTDRLTKAASRLGVYRQCSIGWHEECSQRRAPGPECPCNCVCHVQDADDSQEAVDARQDAASAPVAAGEATLRQLQAAAIRDWVRASEAELALAEPIGGPEGSGYCRGVRSALKNASIRADQIEAGTYTLDTDPQELPR